MRKGPLADLFRATEAGRKVSGAEAASEQPEVDDSTLEEQLADQQQTLEVVLPVDDAPPDPESPDEVEAAVDIASEEIDVEEAASHDDAPAEEASAPVLTAIDGDAAALDRNVEVAPAEALAEPSQTIDISDMTAPKLETSLRRTPRVDASTYAAVIRVVGVGGAGLNAVDRMIEAGISQVEFVAVNTDVQQLRSSEAPVKLHIGKDLTQGLGSGADPALGRAAAEETYDQLKHLLKGSDMVFVTAGEGGGTGSGAAPVVAQIARELDALTVGIVTMPFRFEGTRRQQQAERGLEEMREVCDTLITIPNDRLLEVLDRSTSMVDAFRVADDVLRQGVQGICDLITLPGLINLDFADVRTIMRDAGSALMGIGFASGEDRAREAAERALRSPLIDSEISGARGILLSVAGGDDLTLLEVNEAAEAIREAATTDTNIIFGATVDPGLTGQLWVTVVATGLGGAPARPRVNPGDTLDPPSFLRDL